LLEIFLSEVHKVRLHDIKELQNYRRDATKVAGSGSPFKGRGHLAGEDVGVETRRVNGFGRWSEHDIDLKSTEEVLVVFQVPRVSGQVFRGSKLRGVDKDRSNEDVAFAARPANQTQMALVKRAHGRNQSK